MERLKDEFEDEEEKGIAFFYETLNMCCKLSLFMRPIFSLLEIFVSNVFEQTAEKEMDLICNQVISKVLEKLLPLATPEILRYLLPPAY